MWSSFRARLGGKFQQDVLWNVGSLVVSGVSGILLTYLIGLVYDPAALGVFNQVFAFYIFGSQVAVLGVQYSVLRHVAATSSPAEQGAITRAALAITAALSVAVAVAFWVVAEPAARLLDSPEVAEGLAYAAPGLVFFALNKVLLACLNGQRRMRYFAVFQGGRFLGMLAAFGACVAGNVPAAGLPVILTVSEVVIFLPAFLTVRQTVFARGTHVARDWARIHLRFGVRGGLSGMLVELNTRVDILMLGYFASDTVVGAYSFAAVIAEGFYQFLVVLRSNYNPILAEKLERGAVSELHAIVRRGIKLTYLLALPMAVALVGAYAVAISWLGGDPALGDSTAYLAILVAGITLSAGSVPFNQILLQADLPGWHTVMVAGVVLSNIIGNAALIGWLGASGAAAATAMSFVFAAVLLVSMARRLTGVRF